MFIEYRQKVNITLHFDIENNLSSKHLMVQLLNKFHFSGFTKEKETCERCKTKVKSE